MSVVQARTNYTNELTFNNISELCNYNGYNDIIWLKIENITFTDLFYFPNKIEQLFINHCKNCSKLCYLSNNIRFVEITNCVLNTLKHLFISINAYNDLETLNVSYNRLTNVSDNLPNKLISLNLSYNDIDKLPNINCFSKEIQYINLSYNKLTDLPKWILELNETNLICMPNRFWFNSYSNISLNRDIKEYHIMIAFRFFDSSLANKLITTRNIINNIDTRINDEIEHPLIGYNIGLVKPNDSIVKTTAEQAQNVHNSDIQDSFSKSVSVIMKYAVPKQIKYLSDAWYYYVCDGTNFFNNISFINIITKNCNLTTIVSRCGVTYGEIFERIWSISSVHKYKKEIRNILRDEINAGKQLCFTGQVTRLVNSLSGFVDGVQISYSENEQINNAVIATMRRCENNKLLNVLDEVKKVLDELLVSEEKQEIWLSALE
jgi:Leucine-rich repeat (LRR) protein